jgi:cobalamin synthase
MKTIKKFPYIALLFGVLALVTSYALVSTIPSWLSWLLAIFWLATGCLGIYQGVK